MTFCVIPIRYFSHMNIYLLGDSILDNAVYTNGEPSVTEHLNRLLGKTGIATLVAVDGSVTAEVNRQIQKLPPEATYVVLSSRGNDALAHQDLLKQPARSVAQALLLFAEPLQALEADYRQVLEDLRKIGLSGVCCTIYNGWMDEPFRSVVPLALRLFNDVIVSLLIVVLGGIGQFIDTNEEGLRSTGSTTATPSALEQANEAYENDEYQRASELYNEVINRNTRDGVVWYRYADGTELPIS